MKARISRICIAAAIGLAAGGCAVVSANRVFPKLTWYWSWEAKAQREERKKEQERRQAETNAIVPIPNTGGYPLAERIAKRDGTNFIGVYMGMIAEWDGCTSRYHPPTNYIGGVSGLEFADEGWIEPNAHPQGVMMFSATSGELLKWISYEDFRDIFVLKLKPEYPR